MLCKPPYFWKYFIDLQLPWFWCINPFQANFPSLYLLKLSEYIWFNHVFMGHSNETLTWNELFINFMSIDYISCNISTWFDPYQTNIIRIERLFGWLVSLWVHHWCNMDLICLEYIYIYIYIYINESCHCFPLLIRS